MASTGSSRLTNSGSTTSGFGVCRPRSSPHPHRRRPDLRQGRPVPRTSGRSPTRRVSSWSGLTLAQAGTVARQAEQQGRDQPGAVLAGRAVGQRRPAGLGQRRRAVGAHHRPPACLTPVPGLVATQVAGVQASLPGQQPGPLALLDRHRPPYVAPTGAHGVPIDGSGWCCRLVRLRPSKAASWCHIAQAPTIVRVV
jgi:hypothetical protein